MSVVVVAVVVVVIIALKIFVPGAMMVISLLRLKDIIQPSDLSFWFVSFVHRLTLQKNLLVLEILQTNFSPIFNPLQVDRAVNELA